MAKCGNCSSMIFFGGPRVGDRRYCNQDCLGKGELKHRADQIPHDIVQKALMEVHMGQCLHCKTQNVPIDVHDSYSVYSLVLFTSWKTNRQISCRRCGNWKRFKDFTFSFFFGWWGVPFGLLVTPVQLGKNLFSMFGSDKLGYPSDKLREVVKLELASQAYFESERA